MFDHGGGKVGITVTLALSFGQWTFLHIVMNEFEGILRFLNRINEEHVDTMIVNR